MKIGQYQIGRFHAIIRKEYEDGSVQYETSFSDMDDYMCSVNACLANIGKFCGYGENRKKLTAVRVIRGKENIHLELMGYYVWDLANDKKK